MAGTSYFGKGRNIDEAVNKAQDVTKKKTTKKKVAKKKTAANKEPVYVLDKKTGRYVQR